VASDATTMTPAARAEAAALRLLADGPRVAWSLRRLLRRHGHGGVVWSDRAYAALMQGLVDRGRVAAWTPGPGAMVWYRITAAGCTNGEEVRC
jgi:hypothetical protein